MYSPVPRSSRKWQFIAGAAVFTLLTFLVLPLLDIVSMKTRHSRLPHRLDISALKPPPPLREPPSAQKKREPRRLAKPKLKMNRHLLPLQMALGLDIGLDEPCGDFSLNFPSLDVSELIFELSEVDQPPRPIIKILPFYPPGARARGLIGKVEIAFVVNAEGEVRNIEIISSTPGTVFVNSAVRALERWRFKPAVLQGRPVAARVKLPLLFQLEEK